MKLLRSDARWRSFTQAQRRQIVHWLFAEKLSYRKIRALMQSKLGLKCSVSAVAVIARHMRGVHHAVCAYRTRELLEKRQNSAKSPEDLYAEHRIAVANDVSDAAANPDTVRHLVLPKDVSIQIPTPEIILNENKALERRLNETYKQCHRALMALVFQLPAPPRD
jgi:hypothetical protein